MLGRLDDPPVLPDDPSICTITWAELSVGPLVASTSAEHAASQSRPQQAEADFEPIGLDAAAARAFGRVAQSLCADTSSQHGPSTR